MPADYLVYIYVYLVCFHVGYLVCFHVGVLAYMPLGFLVQARVLHPLLPLVPFGSEASQRVWGV